ncbi:cysteine--tRNA ligase [Patescibacteria group bacterium]|nr:cysteine--tRNA ligase [Patescibacteria group bacterium]
MQNEIYFFDTYTRQKRLFIPLKPGKVRMYTCGPTVYEYPHIGNFRAYVFADTLRRVLEFNSYEVSQVMNITDVGHLTSNADVGEDKIELRARKEGRSAWEIAEFYTNVFKENLKLLNIQSPKIWCKATDHIPEQIALIKHLEKLGYTYRTSDGIYFDTSKFPSYGHLAKLNVRGIRPGARIEISPEKRNSTDFALWKLSPKDGKRQMEWRSPWGIGFPGWHIECSAMAMKYLGETIDIHTGGIDHIPIHHTNEIAQVEAVTKKQFVRYWLHVAFLTIEGGRMGKSEKNFVTLQGIIDKGYDPLALRYLMLTAHYRSRLNFTWKSFRAAEKALSILRERITEWQGSDVNPDEELIREFKKQVNDDLGTPQALSLLWKMVNMRLPEDVKKATFFEFDKILGLRLKEAKSRIVTILPPEIGALLRKRDQLRGQKKWKEADQIRIELQSRGYKIEDTSKSTRVKK